jgi:hypothetical protein
MPRSKLIQIEDPSELDMSWKPFRIESQGEENTYFTDRSGQRYFIKEPSDAQMRILRRLFVERDARPEAIEDPSELDRMRGPFRYQEQGEENLYFRDGKGKLYYIKDPSIAQMRDLNRRFVRASESNLRAALVKLAYTKPELRADLLPLLKEADID